jgi:hypothetical protein
MARRSLAAATLLAVSAASAIAAPPRIRTDADNTVPRCVTPKRLMAFLKTRNPNLDPRFADIASYYKKHGDIWRVRWDYAFFQMAVETNFLTYRTGNGSWGDVTPKQNNFAGLGTTGGGVPGDSYPDVTTGVLAQIQHLVVYSGERIDEPVGARTRLKQDDILVTMASKKGRTTFADLARRWAADRHYGASIEWVANNFRQNFCTGPEPVEEAEAKPTPPKPQKRPGEKQELARAANLGGPEPVNTPEEVAGPPVRTIWSAADGPTTPDTAASEASTAPSSQTEEAAPLPSRKPASPEPGADEVVAEQVIQTGEEPQLAPPSVAELSPPSEPAAEPAKSAEAPEKQHAFAYAAAMSAAMTKPAAATAAAAPSGCRVQTASYGGKKALLVRSGTQTDVRYTVLTVLEGFEKSMLANYVKAHAPDGTSVGEFANKDAALAKARELCPRAAGPLKGEGASAG